MKKLAWMFAALGLCAFSFSACGDDDDNGGKAKVGESCEKAQDCESNVCTDKKCAAKAEDVADGKEGGKCKAGDVCDDGLVCQDKKCVKDSGGSTPADGAENGKCKAGDVCDDGLVCKDNKCYKSCFVHTDCGDGRVCNDAHICVDGSAVVDACKDVTCPTDFDCLAGICVNDAMKALTKGGEYPADVAESFCNGNNLVYKTASSKVDIVDCSKDGYTGCVVFVDPTGENGARAADCNGQQSAIDACVASDKAKIYVCHTETSIYEVYCISDVTGKDIVIPTYKGENDKVCEGSQKCDASSEMPVCK